MIVQGVCSPEFEGLKKIFQEYFDEQKELGANFSIVKNGNVLVNIFGGKKNNENSWDENTIVNTFSPSSELFLLRKKSGGRTKSSGRKKTPALLLILNTR